MHHCSAYGLFPVPPVTWGFCVSLSHGEGWVARATLSPLRIPEQLYRFSPSSRNSHPRCQIRGLCYDTLRYTYYPNPSSKNLKKLSYFQYSRPFVPRVGLRHHFYSFPIQDLFLFKILSKPITVFD